MEEMTQEELLDYIIDKFNLTMNFEKGQLQNIFETVSKKIIAWELSTSVILLIVYTIILLSIILIFNKKNKDLKIVSSTKIWYNGLDFDKISDVELKNRELKMILNIVIMAVFIIAVVSLVVLSVDEVIDIVQCIVFPEKVIAEFIGRYL